MVLKVIVNTEPKGEFFTQITDDGDLLIKKEDLETAGIVGPQGKTVALGGEVYFSLRSMEGITFVFNPKTVSLEIQVPPHLLIPRSLDFQPQRQAKVYYPKDASAFLNYRFDYAAGNDFHFENLNVTTELGGRVGDFLLVSESIYKKFHNQEDFVRLMSQIVYDRRETLQRAVAGDFYASSGELGSTVNLGGLSFSKIYQIDPYLIRYPMLNFSESLYLPSEVEVYLDGTLIRKEKLSPGELNLKNISYYGGYRTVDVVIRDAFGREQRLSAPFYFTDVLLRKGLHEYSYNAGFLREDFGVRSDEYGAMAYSAFHRYALSDSINVGAHGEGTRDLLNLGPQALFGLGRWGLLNLSVCASTGKENRDGLAGSLSHTYQGREVGTRLFLKGYTKDYSTIITPGATERPKYEWGAGWGYGTRFFGSLSADFAYLQKYEGADRRVGTVAYSRNVTSNSTISFSYRSRKESEYSNDFFVLFTYYPWKDISLSASYQKEKGKNVEGIQLQKNPPVGEGYGFRVNVDRSELDSEKYNTVNPFFQYNGPWGIYTAEYRGQYGDRGQIDSYQLSAAGGLGYVGRSFGFSRPISDSFGLVKVGDIPGVTVYQNNQPIGQTDSKGKVFVPNLNSYVDNQITIRDKDIPMEYGISEISKYVSPPLRGGSFIHFEAEKIQAITGRLKIRAAGKDQPAEFQEVRWNVDGQERTFPTSRGGEFYLEHIKPGRYRATVPFQDKSCSFEMVIPKSDEMIIDQGDIVCEEIH